MEIIQFSYVLKKIDSPEAIEHTLVHNGKSSDYKMNEMFFEDLGVCKQNYFLNATGKNAIVTVVKILINFDSVLEEVQSDAFLGLGDANSCLCAITAPKPHISIFHMEVFDQRVLDDSNRKKLDHTVDINLTYSDNAREYLLVEDLRPDRIIMTASHIYELMMNYLPKIKKSTIHVNLLITVNRCFMISAHREEYIASKRNFFRLEELFSLVAATDNLPVIVSIHLRTRKMLEKHNIQFNEHVRLIEPMGLRDYNSLQMSAKTVLSDCGTRSEESSIFNFRALNICEVHEYLEAMGEANVMMVGLNPERAIQGLLQLDQQKTGTERNFRSVADCSISNVSDIVVRIILSYMDYVKRVVWNE